MRSSVLLFALAFSTAAQAQSLQSEPATVQVGVLSLFHPRTLILSADHPVTLLLDGMPEILDAHQQATLSAAADGLRVTFPGSQGLAARRLTLPESSFTLAVPEKLTRNYRGSLSVTVRSGTLTPVIAMDTELAVASIVAAESPPHAPAEALKAQAIASRSFLLANRGAHQGFDACDTTHCQYLRSPPTASSPAAIATRSTRGMVLTWRASPEALPQIVRAMYSRSCGGQTRVPPASVTANSYPFYPVRCEYCRRHPEVWSRPAGTPAPVSEQDRIAYNRGHGWSAIPSNNATESSGTLEGRGTGHGIGLCQLGAADLAARGNKFPAILGQYFPNTALTQLP